MVKIGIICVKGSMPAYETFGYLPNRIIRNLDEIHTCDLVIIPPGYIVETLKDLEFIKRELYKYYTNGGLIIGVCSGFQLLSKFVETEKRTIKCLDMLDVKFRPLICTDIVSVELKYRSWLFRDVDKLRNVFHAHTFAPVEIGDVKIVGISYPRRVNYFEKGIPIISIVCSKDERIHGILPHNVFNNHKVVENVCNYLGIKDFEEHKKRSMEVFKELKDSIYLSRGVACIQNNLKNIKKVIICIASLATSDGKTFITTGISYALKVRGYNVYVLKLGGDVRDIHPPLYILREYVRDYSCIIIKGKRDYYGWTSAEKALRRALEEFDIVLVEGVMGLLTGISYRVDNYQITSTIDFINKFKIPYILVCSPTYGGIEDLYIRLKAYLKLLSMKNILPICVIVNKCYDLENRYVKLIMNLCNKYGVDTYVIPCIRFSKYTHPEIDLDIDTYTKTAYELVEKYVDVDNILSKCHKYFKRVTERLIKGKLKNEDHDRSRE